MHQEIDNATVLGQLINGAVWDFIMFLAQRPDGIIVGGGHPIEPLIEEASDWIAKYKLAGGIANQAFFRDYAAKV